MGRGDNRRVGDWLQSGRLRLGVEASGQTPARDLARSRGRQARAAGGAKPLAGLHKLRCDRLIDSARLRISAMNLSPVRIAGGLSPAAAAAVGTVRT